MFTIIRDVDHNFTEDMDYDLFTSEAQAKKEVLRRCMKIWDTYGVKNNSEAFAEYVRQMWDKMIGRAEVEDDIACTLYCVGWVVAFRNETEIEAVS